MKSDQIFGRYDLEIGGINVKCDNQQFWRHQFEDDSLATLEGDIDDKDNDSLASFDDDKDKETASLHCVAFDDMLNIRISDRKKHRHTMN